MFDRMGVIAYPAKIASPETVFEAAVEAGASNVESSAELHEVTCDPDDFTAVRDALTEKFGDPTSAELTWRPQTTVAIDEERAQTMLKLRSEEHTSELQSLMRSSYAVFCLKTKTKKQAHTPIQTN